jgi:CheY-like chemotaxis protein
MLRILLADDDETTLDFLRAALEAPGVEIREATSGAELLDLLAHAGRFDVVVTDVVMSWMNGTSVLASARAAGLQTPAIVLTGSRDPRLPDEVERLGHARLLHKPVGIDQIAGAVEELVGRSARGLPAA